MKNSSIQNNNSYSKRCRENITYNIRFFVLLVVVFILVTTINEVPNY